MRNLNNILEDELTELEEELIKKTNNRISKSLNKKKKNKPIVQKENEIKLPPIEIFSQVVQNYLESIGYRNLNLKTTYAKDCNGRTEPKPICAQITYNGGEQRFRFFESTSIQLNCKELMDTCYGNPRMDQKDPHSIIENIEYLIMERKKKVEKKLLETSTHKIIDPKNQVNIGILNGSGKLFEKIGYKVSQLEKNN